MTETHAEPGADEDQAPEHECIDGWITLQDDAGMPVPCLVCKPHIGEQRRRLRDRLHGPKQQHQQEAP